MVADADVRAAIARLGGEIAAAFPDGVLLVSLLKGSVIFLADLVRAIPPSVPVEVDFMAISSYAPETGRVRILKDLDTDIHERDVVLVEDIVDTGLTTAYVRGELERRGPRALDVCALLDKAVRRLVPTPLRFVGFEVDDRFLLGYGLDHAERYSNLGDIVEGDLARLLDDPDVHVSDLYGSGGGTVSA